MRRMMLAMLLVATGGCSGEQAPVPTAPPAGTPDTGMAPFARYILDQIVLRMEHNSVKRKEINWTTFRAEVFARAQNAQAPDALEPAILHALTLLNDGHSALITPTGRRIAYRPVVCDAPVVAKPVVPAGIGYVRIAGFAGTPAEATAFADQIQASLAEQDRADLRGWIVDLRRNTGGSMWPMLAGIGPLLGDTLAGSTVDPDGFTERWTYRNGSSFNNGIVQARATSGYSMRRPSMRVAVLTDKLTASSGEAVAVAFQGRPNTRVFGTETCGQSTANYGYQQNDLSMLVLTVAVMADRTGATYGRPLQPDERIALPDSVAPKAIAWLLASP